MNELEYINNQLSVLRKEYVALEEQGKLTPEFDSTYCLLVDELCKKRTILYWRQMQQ